jgi:hypothetical protein
MNREQECLRQWMIHAGFFRRRSELPMRATGRDSGVRLERAELSE